MSENWCYLQHRGILPFYVLGEVYFYTRYHFHHLTRGIDGKGKDDQKGVLNNMWQFLSNKGNSKITPIRVIIGSIKLGFFSGSDNIVKSF